MMTTTTIGFRFNFECFKFVWEVQRISFYYNVNLSGSSSDKVVDVDKLGLMG